MSIDLAYGEVSAIDYPNCRIRVRLEDRDGLQTYWLNIPQRNTQGTKRRPLMPELGEQVAVLLDADGVGGVYLGGIYSTAEPPPVGDEDTDYVRFSDGTVSAYDRAAGVMRLECVGALVMKCARNITIEAGGLVVVKASSVTLDISQVTLNGDLRVNGDIESTGSIMDTRGNSNHHSH
ncbi:phage baseplate assembly protein V [Pseudomonas sp. NFACC15-1]|uniref:phage baseplate assembly protein V n=1 Tax=unclassified Pseudomonas TaxID=196821 RepID=UPI000891351E|nr:MULTISPECIES: phage baseplate assembly protein V [unclassified Pseudomonas]SDA63272.1 phage baseplate assembly protein V [Pseudomonas sp. NFACC15-1]SDX92709.1 phage baseplate assembly protein V [Pseudomonas sp. NFACC14]